jgi:hypothetical protein
MPGVDWRERHQPRSIILDWAIGGLVLLVCLLVEIAFLQGPHPYDPATYFRTALDFPSVPSNLFTLRIGLVGSIRAAMFVFGPSEATLYAVPIVASALVLPAAVYATMILMFGDRIGAAAAAMVTVLNTNYLLNASSAFPDTVGTATFAAGFLFLVLGWVREDRAIAASVFTLCAGALFGWTYLIREFSFVLLPAVIAAAVLMRYPMRRVVLLMSAFVATASLELLYGTLVYGRPFEHIQALLGRGDTPFSQARHIRTEHIQSQLSTPLDTLVVFPRLVLSWRVGWAFLLLVAIFIVGLARLRDRRLWILGVWCFGFWLFMAVIGLGTLPSGRWILNITNIRYWYPMLPALVMGAFGTLVLVIRSVSPNRRAVLATQAVTVLLALLVLAPGFVEFRNCASAHPWRNDPGQRWNDLRDWFSRPEARQYDRVLTDFQTFRLLPAFIRTTFGHPVWPGSVKKFTLSGRGISPRKEAEHTLILIHIDRFRFLPGAQQRLNELRRDWAPVFKSQDGRMIILANRSVTEGEAFEAQRQWWNLAAYPSAERPRYCGLSPYEPPI